MVEAQLSLLLNVGLLTRHTASRDRYLFAMPNAGPLVRAIVAGRKVTMLSRPVDNLMSKLLTLPFQARMCHDLCCRVYARCGHACMAVHICASCADVVDSLHGVLHTFGSVFTCCDAITRGPLYHCACR